MNRPVMTVMVVDDSSLMRRVLSDLISEVSWLRVVAEAADGEQALSQLQTCSPDLILLDIEMPVMDGITFLKHARLATDARIIVISSVVPLASARALAALDLGAVDIVPKPAGVVSLNIRETSQNALIQAMTDALDGW